MRTLSILTALVIGLAIGLNIATAAPRPNVVIIYTDDQGTLDAGCYGSDDLYTPAMDEIAATGVRFTQAYAHTVCCPSRAALLTGRHPQRSGVNSWTQGNLASELGLNMALAEVTLAEALREAGYRTALFGKWHLGAAATHGPTKQGFDEFFGLRGGFIDNYNHHFLHGSGFHDLYEGTEKIDGEGKYFPQMMTDRALTFIDKNREDPFFLYFALNIPHYPEQALEKFGERYKDLPMPHRSYAAMISTTDHYIGKVLAKLTEHGLRDNTIVIFMSDNGHSAEHNEIRSDGHKSGLEKGHYYGAHGGGGNTGRFIGHKGTFYEGGLRVPAIISYPKALPQGEVRRQAISAMDWYPTVIELCGIETDKEIALDGASVVPLIRDAKRGGLHDEMHWGWQRRWAVRKGDWKLVSQGIWEWREGQPLPKGTHLGKLSDATPEKKNYAAEMAPVLLQLKAAHDAWAEDVGFSGK